MNNREIVVDNFAGGGGASTGIEIAAQLGISRFYDNRIISAYQKKTADASLVKECPS